MDRRKLATKAEERRVRAALMDSFALEDLHDYRVDRNTFTIFVGGDTNAASTAEEGGGEPGVEHHMADRFEINMALLSRLNPNRPILVSLSSCGGNWDEGMQMFGAILTCPNPVTVLATKWARSMTSIIPLAADRFLLRPPAQYMIHHGTNAYAGLAGEQMDTWKEEADKARQTMLNIYVTRLREQGKHSARAESYTRALLMRKMQAKVDFWLSPDDAVDWGFADGVFAGDHATLRAKHVNRDRRAAMMTAIRSR